MNDAFDERLSPSEDAGMTKTQFAVLALLFIGTQGAVQFAMSHVIPGKVPPQWAYRTFYHEKRETGRYYGADIAELGKQGWQLVSVVPSGDGNICYFKKPLTSLDQNEEDDGDKKKKKDDDE